MRARNETMVRAIAGGSLVLLLGCGAGGLKIRSQHDRDASFDHLDHYAWIEADETSPRDPRLANKDTDRRIRAAVDRELARRGYTRVDGEDADFLVQYHAVLEGGLDTMVLDSSYGTGPGWVYDGSWTWGPGTSGSYVRKYRQGTLVLDIVDPASGALIWRASAQARVHVEASADDRARRLSDVVRQMLDRFPPTG